MRDCLEMWVIYDHPADYPDHFIARKRVIDAGQDIATSELKLGNTLEEVRRAIPQGLFCLPRHPSDVTCIVETWV